MKGERFRRAVQAANTAIAVSHEVRSFIRQAAKPGEAVDDTVRRLLGLAPRDRAAVRLGPPEEVQ